MRYLRCLISVAALHWIVGCGPPKPTDSNPSVSAGPAGSTIEAVGGVFCSGRATFGAVEVTLYHQRFNFSDGTLFVSCSVIATNTVEARKDGLPWFWKPDAPENAISHCWVAHDLGTSDGLGEGRFDFYLAPDQDHGYAVYSDNPGSGYEYNGAKINTSCEPI